MDIANRNSLMGKRLIGKVVDNNDPEQLRRVKVKVPEVYGADISNEDLPWCIPTNLSVIGNTSACQFFGVPIIDSIVSVTFQHGDPLFPEYSSSPTTPQTVPDLFKTNYPNRYGWIDEQANHFFIDRTTGDLELHHNSGTMIQINPDGRVTVTAVENVHLEVTGDVTANVGGNLDAQIAGTGRVESGGELTLQGSDVTIIGGTIRHQGQVQGNSTATYSGDVRGQGISLATHRHGGVDTGGGTTAPPQ